MNNKIQEIKDRHKNATQSPWYYDFDRPHPYLESIVYDKNNEVICSLPSHDDEIKEANLNFISNSPSDIAYLLSEYDRIQSENERFRQALNKICAKANEDSISNIAFDALHEDGDK